MNIFFPKEQDNETRFSLTGETAQKFLKKNINLSIQENINLQDALLEKLIEENSINIVSREEGLKSANIICNLNKLSFDDIAKINPDTLAISFLDPFNEKQLIEEFRKKSISSISMELIPRTTRAQKMDALSSQANLAGYSAVIIASNLLEKALPMMMTAAGTISPSKVFVVGVGVAGLQAIATAKRLGARVEAFDTRPVVEDQVKSLGARFIKIDLGETEETNQGYAKALTEEQIKKQQEGMKKVCANSDIVITTAQVFGRPAPKIITSEMVQAMQPGSVIVDMAVSSGGNVEGSQMGEIIDIKGVKIIGNSNLPGEVPTHSSQVYANNIYNLIDEFWDEETSSFKYDLNDEILANCLVTHKGNYINASVKERNE
ncbi:MAG: NAD(P) transhydrogenase subunit alpha [Pseudomonadota bacterium]|jgi:NAD(P) transhydrogenase subunit alpha|nr:NAD(P) transhydrogenase subunit alpha [Pseudomonadota bacterium]MEC7787514.1 NAD(P) transhydrogenase subunit alpha [Pseudomonadota bacterium]MEC8108408.1 NAD(P) transhydrogenase subunit alpha [Pseudomonadota bacterium]MEC8169505.1 NAD(P) transhydrogenase subunit alpha [Pseudomonadota bacterium]MEC8377734.1 NAD(P) transhydrogenase subunit alpha [Pseudomonadota bacterium]